MKIEIEVPGDIYARLLEVAEERKTTVESLATSAVDDAYRISSKNRNMRRRKLAIEKYLKRHPNATARMAFFAGYSYGWIEFQMRHLDLPEDKEGLDVL